MTPHVAPQNRYIVVWTADIIKKMMTTCISFEVAAFSPCAPPFELWCPNCFALSFEIISILANKIKVRINNIIVEKTYLFSVVKIIFRINRVVALIPSLVSIDSLREAHRKHMTAIPIVAKISRFTVRIILAFNGKKITMMRSIQNATRTH